MCSKSHMRSKWCMPLIWFICSVENFIDRSAGLTPFSWLCGCTLAYRELWSHLKLHAYWDYVHVSKFAVEQAVIFSLGQPVCTVLVNQLEKTAEMRIERVPNVLSLVYVSLSLECLNALKEQLRQFSMQCTTLYFSFSFLTWSVH